MERWNVDELRKKYAEGIRDFEPVVFASDTLIEKAENVIEEAREAVGPDLEGELWEAVRDISLNILFGEDPSWIDEYPDEELKLVAIGIIEAVCVLITTKEFVKSGKE
ncbi:hypothetical protein DRN74_06495 [Candidatus Micrarchaeota archaeon]|nr:MAG: hypothetical protein DRN74_06495 [Candidatus Micrarchaeota archaeon]